MFFQIDFQNGLAVYDQVVRQVKFAVAAKLLAEGSMVPSVRELAGELAINPNTVARAYRQLQDDGVLSPVRGTGLAVAAGACGRCQSERLESCASASNRYFRRPGRAGSIRRRCGPLSISSWQRLKQNNRKGGPTWTPLLASVKCRSATVRRPPWTRSSFVVPRGTVFALLGENGAGKTTAIRIMLGLTEADSGQAEVLGLSCDKRGLEIRQRVGYVAERPTLYEWMTVAEIGWFTAGFYGPNFLPEYLRLAEKFRLPPGRKLKALSKGMRAMVALSLALANGPELLVLDEPTSGLDALVRREFLESMVDRAAQGQTVLLSSHQIGEVERVADIVAIVRKSKLLLVQRVDELKAQVRRVTVTLKEGATVAPEFPFSIWERAGGTGGEVLGQRWKPRQWQSLVRGADDEQLAALRGDEAVENVEVHSTSLEDIFVAYMQNGDAAAGSPASKEAPQPC